MNEGRLLAFGPCWSCGHLFTFDPDLVPSIPIDPDTNWALDLDRHGQPTTYTAADYLRSVKQPVCEACVQQANELRRAHGRPLIDVLPGAYVR